jgi:hypothetical protein
MTHNASHAAVSLGGGQGLLLHGYGYNRRLTTFLDLLPTPSLPLEQPPIKARQQEPVESSLQAHTDNSSRQQYVCRAGTCATVWQEFLLQLQPRLCAVLLSQLLRCCICIPLLLLQLSCCDSYCCSAAVQFQCHCNTATAFRPGCCLNWHQCVCQR